MDCPRAKRNELVSETLEGFWAQEVIGKRDALNQRVDANVVDALQVETASAVERRLKKFNTILELESLQEVLTSAWRSFIQDQEGRLTANSREIKKAYEECPHSINHSDGTNVTNPLPELINVGLNTAKSRILGYAEAVFGWERIDDPAKIAEIIRTSTGLVLMTSKLDISKVIPKPIWKAIDPIQITPEQTRLVFSAQARSFLKAAQDKSVRECPARSAIVQSPYDPKQKIPLLQDVMYWLADRIERDIR